jgi:glucose/arabinose dehydrogenase
VFNDEERQITGRREDGKVMRIENSPLPSFPTSCGSISNGLLALLVAFVACARGDPQVATVPPPPPQVMAATHHEIRFADLPPPVLTPDTDNPPRVVARPPNAELRLPNGFAMAPFAEGGFQRPRWLALAPNGDVFLSDADAGALYVLRGIDSGGSAKERFTFATGLNKPFGIAFAPGWVYVGDTDAVLRLPYRSGDTQAQGTAEHIAALPGRGYHEHWTRNLLFDKGHTKLYVCVGSVSNDEADPEQERATILQMAPDGAGRRIFASGVRNPIGLAWRPGTDELWAAVQERDRLGDDQVPDYITHVVDGAFYGWPFAYLGPHDDPTHAGERPDIVARTRAPELLLGAHSGVIALVFYDGTMFPPDWRGDAIVSLHGSWNRSRRTGYALARAHFANGKPAGGYDDFVTGWMLSPDRPEVWGRPVGMLVLPDGSLLVVDDGAGIVWRITYRPGSQP